MHVNRKHDLHSIETTARYQEREEKTLCSFISYVEVRRDFGRTVAISFRKKRSTSTSLTPKEPQTIGDLCFLLLKIFYAVPFLLIPLKLEKMMRGNCSSVSSLLPIFRLCVQYNSIHSGVVAVLDPIHWRAKS